MNVRLGITLKVFKGGRQIYIQMKAYKFISKCKALTQVVGVLSGNNTILCEEKNKYECTVGYNFSFQGRFSISS